MNPQTGEIVKGYVPGYLALTKTEAKRLGKLKAPDRPAALRKMRSVTRAKKAKRK